MANQLDERYLEAYNKGKLAERQLRAEDEDSSYMENMVMVMFMVIMFAAIMTTLPSLNALAAQSSLTSFQGQTESEYLLAMKVQREYKTPHPWITVSLTNDGLAGDIYVALNAHDADEILLVSGEIASISKIGASERITSIFYRCVAPTAIPLRVVGEY